MATLAMSSTPAIPEEPYGAYEHAFRAFSAAAKDPRASLSSVAHELQRLLDGHSGELVEAVSLALKDALACLPPKSREHFLRALEKTDADEPPGRS